MQGPMEQTGPGPWIDIENLDWLCQNGASQMLILDQISLQVCRGGFCRDLSANRTVSIPKCSSSGLLCVPFLDKRGFIKFDHLGVTPFPHTKPPPVLPHLLLQSAWQVPSPSLLCAEPEAAAGLGRGTQTPPCHKEPCPCHRCDSQGGSRSHTGCRMGRAGSTASCGFILHIPCSYTDPSLGKSRLRHRGAESSCTELRVP